MAILAWAFYKLYHEFVALRERVQRQDRRLNEVLYRVSRKKPE